MMKSIRGNVRQYALIAFIFALALICSVSGWRMIQMAGPMAGFTDPNRAERMRIERPPDDAVARKAFTENWNREFNAMITPKWDIHDRGVALIIFSGCMVVAAMVFRLWKPGAMSHMKAPGPWIFAGLALIAYISLTPITIMLVEDDFQRNHLPVWGDTLAIPIFGMIVVQVIGLVVFLPLLIVFTLLSCKRNLLWAWNSDHIECWLASLLAMSIVLGLVWLICKSLQYGPGYELPTLFCMIYLTLAARAGLVAKSKAAV